jgi:hypothetical protein
VTRGSLAPLALIAATGCTPPDPAPTELSDLLLFAWRHADTERATNHVSLADAGQNLAQWYDQALAAKVDEEPDYDVSQGLDNRLDEGDQRLSEDDLRALDPTPGEVAGEDAVGVVVARSTPCTLDDYTRRDQRGYDCFADGCEEAAWITSLVQSQQVLLSTITYDYDLANAMRVIDGTPPDSDEPVAGRMVRAWMMDPAVVTPDDFGLFTQNLQLELITERPDGGSLHIYAQWTEVRSDAINTEAPVFLNSYVDGLRDYMIQLESWCEGA